MTPFPVRRLRVLAVGSTVVAAGLALAVASSERSANAADATLHYGIESVEMEFGAPSSWVPSSRIVLPATVTYGDGSRRSCSVETRVLRVDGQVSYSPPRVVHCLAARAR